MTDNSDSNEIYYNIIIKNNSTGYNTSGVATGEDIEVPLIFDETRTIPFVERPSEYFLSVVSFQADTQGVPVFICDAVPGSLNINKTSYYVSIETQAGLIFQENITWVPEYTTATPPPTPVPNDYNNYDYYYSWTVNHFINLVNIALSNVYTAAGQTGRPPFIKYENGLLSIVGSRLQFRTTLNGGFNGSGSPDLKLFFNTELYNYFSSFSAIKQVEPYATTYYGMNYQILFVEDLTNAKPVYTNLTQVPPTTNYTGIYNNANFSPFGFWNPIESIVFCAQYINITPEMFSAPPNAQFTNSNANSYYILTDYSSKLNTGFEYKPTIYYQPNSEYRLADLNGETPLRQLRIEVYWKDYFGYLHPFYIEAGGVASLKILFRKKAFYGLVDEEEK